MTDHCEELLEKLFRYIDRELPEEELRFIAEHLEECGQCEAEYRIYVRIRKMVASCPHEVAPDCLREKVRGIIDQAKEVG